MNQEMAQSDTVRRPTNPNATLRTTPPALASLASDRQSSTLIGLAGAEPAPGASRATATIGLFDSTWGGANLGRRASAANIQPKPSTGSGLLLDDSKPETWLRGTNSGSLGSLGAVAPAQRSTIADTSPHLNNGGPINLNGANGHRSRPSYAANFTNPSSLANYDQPPAVYTRAERHGPSSTTADGQMTESMVRPTDSAQHSPAEERRSWIASGGFPAKTSLPTSRNSSLPPSRDGDVLSGRNKGYSQGGTDPAARAAMQLATMSINEPRSSMGFHQANTSISHTHGLSSGGSAAAQSRRTSRQYDSPPMSSSRQSINNAAYPAGDIQTRQSPHNGTQDPYWSPQHHLAYPGGFQQPPPAHWNQYPAQARPHDPSMYTSQMQHYGPPYPHSPIPRANQMAPPPYQHSGPASPHDSQNGIVTRSHVLHDYKTNGRTNGRYELRDVIGHVVEFCGDQHGSRFIQAKLASASSEEKNIIFHEILTNSVQLMTDIFGNYVIQKLFDIGDQYQKRALAATMKGHVLSLSQHVYGCRVVQKALEQILTDQQATLIGELSNDVMRCLRDQNGNHVLQKAIERCQPDAIRFIFETFEGQIMTISQHAYGCRIIQRCLEFCRQPEKDAIMSEIQGGMASLVSDNYGNYVVQHVVKFGNEVEQRFALDVVLSNLEFFCKHKFASNVVEVCIKFGGPEFKRQLLDRFVSVNKRTHESMASSLIRDGYGNYVLQSLLDALPQGEHQQLVEHLYPEVQKAKKTISGKQLASIEKKMQRFGYNGQQLHSAHQSRAASAEATPALTFTSIQSSALSSVNGDTVDGTMTSRKP